MRDTSNSQKSADATGDQSAKEFFQEAADTWGASR